MGHQDKVAASDTVIADLQTNSQLCNAIMHCVDDCADQVMTTGMRAAAAEQVTSLDEVVARFRRALEDRLR